MLNVELFENRITPVIPGYDGAIITELRSDFDHDGYLDPVSTPTEAAGPRVTVSSGRTGVILADFFAYEIEYRGSINVVSADIDGDGSIEIVTGTGLGGGPAVKVFSDKGVPKAAWFAFESTFRGGVRVGAANGIIATTPSVGGGPVIRAFDEFGAERFSVLVGDSALRNGLSVAVDLDKIWIGGDSLTRFSYEGELLDQFDPLPASNEIPQSVLSFWASRDATPIVPATTLEGLRQQVASYGVITSEASRPLNDFELRSIISSVALLPDSLRSNVKLKVLAGKSILEFPELKFAAGFRTPDGRDYDGVAGVYNPADGFAYVVVGAGAKAYNGSVNVVLHELGHQFDGGRSIAAPWNNDIEMFAEGFARYLVGAPVSENQAFFYKDFIND